MEAAPSRSVLVGIDVAKDRVDGSVRPRGERFACATDPDSLAALAEELRPLEAPVAAALAAVGLPVAIVNPRPVRQFAGAIGRLAKPVLGPANDRTRGPTRSMPPSPPSSPRRSDPRRGPCPTLSAAGCASCSAAAASSWS